MKKTMKHSLFNILIIFTNSLKQTVVIIIRLYEMKKIHVLIFSIGTLLDNSTLFSRTLKHLYFS